MAFDPYEQLGLDRTADDQAIRLAYRRKARLHHPDRNPDDPYAETRFKLCKEAYELLSDPDRRQRYDRGEDASAVNIDRQSRQQIVQVFLTTLTKHVDGRIVSAMRAHLTSERRRLAKEAEKGDQANRGLETVRSRFTYKGSGENILLDAIEGQIASNRVRISQVDRAIEVVDRSIEILDEYEDNDLMQLSWTEMAGVSSTSTSQT